MDIPQFTLSVHCTTYNHANYIRETLNGFMIQKTSFPFVCVIVDDASTDGEQEVIKNHLCEHFDLKKESNSYCEETEDYIMMFARHKNNQNCFFAVYLLKYNYYQRKKSKMPFFSFWNEMSEYCAICEGDDYWTASCKLEKQVRYMKKHPECVLTFSNAFFVRPDSSVRWLNTISVLLKIECQNIGFKFHKNKMTVLLKNGNILQTASVCFRNHEKEWANFSKEIPFKMLMRDKPRWLYYSTLGDFKCFHSFMSAYRILPESASHTKDYGKLLRFKDNAEEIARYFNNYFKVIPEKELDKIYRISECRKSALVSPKDFIELWKRLIKDYPSQLFNIRLIIIAFVRIILKRDF